MRASLRHLVVLPSVALVALAAACGGTGPAVTQPSTPSHPAGAGHPGSSGSAGQTKPTAAPPSSTAPSSSSAVPTTSLPPTAGLAALRSIRWTSVTVPGDVCPGRPAPIKLSHGKATIPAPPGVHAPTGVEVSAGAHVFGDLYGPGHDIAALDVWCARPNGSAADQLENSWVLYAGSGGSPQPIATLVPQQPASAGKGLHVPYFAKPPGGIVIAPGTVTVKELWYTAADKTCCPSEHVTTIWHAHGTSFSAYTSVGG